MTTTQQMCAAVLLLAAVVLAQTQAPLTTSLWSTQVTNTSSTLSGSPPPVTFNGTTIFASVYYSGSLSSRNTISCVNDTNGAILWSNTTWSSVTFLTLQGTQIIAQASGWIAGISPQGAQLWNLSAAAVDYKFSSSQGPLLSTDSNTLYTYGVMGNSSGTYFTIFTVDLTTGAALTPVFTSTSSYFYYTSSLMGAYLFPVNGTDYLFLFGSSYYYYQADTSNFTKTVRQGGSYSNVYAANPVIDALNGLVYLSAASSDAIIVNDFATGNTLASLSLSYNGSSSWSASYLLGTYAANGALTSLSGFATYSSSRSSFFQVMPYNGTALNLGTFVATQPGAQQYPIIGGDRTNPNVVLAYLIDRQGNFAAFNVSSFTWVWTTPTIFQSSPSLYAVQTVNGKIYAVLNGAPLGSTSSTSRDRLVVLDAMTGAYIASYTTPSSFSTMWVTTDYYTAVGASVLLYSNNGQLLSVLGTATGTANSLAAGAISTRVLYLNDALYFGTGGRNLTCVGATNGSVLFTNPVIPSSANNNFNPVLAPVLANGVVFILSNAYYSYGNDYTLYAIANSGKGTVTPIPSSTWGSACTQSSSVAARGPIVVSPDQSYIYFAGGQGQCVVQIATSGSYTVTVSNSKNSNSVYQTPLPVGNFVYSADNAGYLSFMRASSFNSATFTVTTKSTAGTGTSYNYPSDFNYAEGKLYFSSGNQVFDYDPIVLLQNWGATLPSGLYLPSIYGTTANQYAPTGFYRGNIYTCVQNTSASQYGVAAFNAFGNFIGSGTKTTWLTMIPGATQPLFYPAISPDGIFVFANLAGVFAIRYDGTYLWSRTGLDCSDYTSYPTTFQVPTINMGVIYVVCNNAMHLMDLYRNGADWQVGSTVDYSTNSQSPNYYTAAGVQYLVNPNTNQIITINRNQFSLSNVTGQLYSASQLPAPLPAYNPSLLDELKANKLWIAGAVLGVIVVIVIIIVAKKMSGRNARRDNDYVTMQSMEKPVNQV